MENLLIVARQAACEAGQLLRSRVGQAQQIRYKGEINLVTQSDLDAERIILDRISSRFPTHGILSEEGGGKKQGHDILWVIDPLDGTTNFAHGYPVFCVSIAVLVEGVPSVGVIVDPMRNEVFCALKNKGATLNGQPIRVSSCETLQRALAVTGFVYDRGDDILLPMRRFERMQLACEGLRRDGSAALNLAYTACGRFDAFFELRLNPWDVAAGFVLIREAGGMVTCSDGRDAGIYDRDVVASNPVLHRELLSVLSEVQV